ncbi:MAG TPA: MaoC family dehydratase [Mycobacteriales bacterium]|jgi:acyl dehydratase|nr:MaoC family dehydratase [Mycobacteriales bacterium]
MGTRVLSETDFAAPPDDRWFEDYAAGAVYEYGHLSVTEEEILEFAGRYDPQPIHVDRAYAASGPFGGIIGSGWQSGSLAMRLIADHYLSRVASLASPGLDELRWQVPLRPGDTLRLRVTILETRTSRSRPDRGVVLTGAELLNQDDGRPITFRATNFLRRRPEPRLSSGR